MLLSTKEIKKCESKLASLVNIIDEFRQTIINGNIKKLTFEQVLRIE